MAVLPDGTKGSYFTFSSWLVVSDEFVGEERWLTEMGVAVGRNNLTLLEFGSGRNLKHEG